MDLTNSKSFDGDNDQTSQQPQSGLEDTFKSDPSSRMDFNRNGIFVERTLALIKPDAVTKADEIEAIILNHGFTILQVSYLSSHQNKKQKNESSMYRFVFLTSFRNGV